MELPQQDQDEVAHLRRIARDLVAMSTLPSAWKQLDARGVGDSLAGVLVSTLDLNFAYVRLAGGEHGAATELLRGAHPNQDRHQHAALLAQLRDATGATTMVDPASGRALRIRVTRIGLASELGVLVCASERADFPNEHERLLIGVGANQGAVVLQRLLAEEALRRSQVRFMELADAAPAMLWVTEPDGDCSFLSRGWYAFTGQTKDQGLGFGWTEAIHPEDRAAARSAFVAANRSRCEFNIEHRLLHVDGSYRWVIDAGRPRFDADGAFLGFVGNVLDIHDKRQADQALDALRTMLAQVFEALPVGIAVANQEGRVLLSNKEMQRYLPTHLLPSLDEARRHRWQGTGPDGKPLEAAEFAGQRAMNGETVLPGLEMLYTDDAGVQCWTLVAAVPLLDQHGARSGQVCIVTDIDAFKRTEDALRLAEGRQRALFDEVTAAHRNLTEFLAVLAHELRNPLAPIVSGLELMRMRADSAATVANVRGMIERQVKQLSHLIDDLLDIARVTSGKIDVRKRRAELKDIVANAVETSMPQIERGQHAFTLRLEQGPLPVEVDAARIAQVIGNLLTNAAKYTPAGGAIDLQVERAGDDALITVADNGVGIPADALESVFDMFSQVGRNLQHAQGGLGIGLSLVRQLVALHGGAVEARSDGPGSGSRFMVRLPLAAAADAPPADAAPQALAATGTRLRILVTDDNQDAAATLGALLAMHGHELRIANDGQQALQIAAQFRPQVIFLDIGMPGMDGYETARRLRAGTPPQQAILVALSGWGAPADLARSTQAGFDRHFIKPIGAEQLQAYLASLVF